MRLVRSRAARTPQRRDWPAGVRGATFESDPGHQALLGSQGLYHGLVSPVFRDQTTLSALLYVGIVLTR